MYKRIRGTKDIFDAREKVFSFVERILFDIASLYNISRVRTPAFEKKDLFLHSGDSSEIVQKQMYEFTDRKGRELVLKPEGTAPTIRAIIENKLYTNGENCKLFYFDKMYRYERPQKGRQREFHQFGVEFVGALNVLNDIELVQMAITILESLKINEFVLEINSLGSVETQKNYSKILNQYFKENINELGENAKSRIDINPLRILDDKIEIVKPYFKKIPKIQDSYSSDDKIYFDNLIEILNILNIKYKINDKLVRGLDYYSNFVFEFISTKQDNSQNTIIAGGCYKKLISDLGGPNIEGVGFAIGIERLIDNISDDLINQITKEYIDIYLINMSDSHKIASLTLVQFLRKSGLKVEWNKKSGKLNKLFKNAAKYNPNYIIICGPKETAEGKVIIKNQKTNVQKTLLFKDIINYIEKKE